jgi:hypothetical protein
LLLSVVFLSKHIVDVLHKIVDKLMSITCLQF